MKKKVLAVVFVLAPLLSVMAGTQFVSLGEANPFWPFGPILPDDAKAPVISILSPANNTVINQDNVVLSFKVDVGESETALDAVLVFVRYETDWQHNNLDHFFLRNSASFSHKVNLTGIPEGTHSIAFQAIERATFKLLDKYEHAFDIDSSETIFFTIDTNPITDIPEFPSWIILPLFLMATLFAIVIKKRVFHQIHKH